MLQSAWGFKIMLSSIASSFNVLCILVFMCWVIHCPATQITWIRSIKCLQKYQCLESLVCGMYIQTSPVLQNLSGFFWLLLLGNHDSYKRHGQNIRNTAITVLKKAKPLNKPSPLSWTDWINTDFKIHKTCMYPLNVTPNYNENTMNNLPLKWIYWSAPPSHFFCVPTLFKVYFFRKHETRPQPHWKPFFFYRFDICFLPFGIDELLTLPLCSTQGSTSPAKRGLLWCQTSAKMAQREGNGTQTSQH